MELKEFDYQKIQEVMDSKGIAIFINIFNEYFNYISNDKDKVNSLKIKEKLKLDKDNNLVSVGRIAVVDRPNDIDIKDFGGIDRVPPGHGGRHKSDDLIHVYPYSYALNKIENLEEMIKLLVNEIVVHEIFHFYIKTDVYNGLEEESNIDKKFKHGLTEGIIQTLTNKYMSEHKLGTSQTGYVEEVLLVSNIINDLKQQNYGEQQIIYFLLNDNYKELIKRCKDGYNIKNNYIILKHLHEEIIKLLKDLFNYDKKLLIELVYRFKNMVNMEEMYESLVDLIQIYDLAPRYLIEIDNIFCVVKNDREKFKI